MMKYARSVGAISRAFDGFGKGYGVLLKDDGTMPDAGQAPVVEIRNPSESMIPAGSLLQVVEQYSFDQQRSFYDIISVFNR